MQPDAEEQLVYLGLDLGTGSLKAVILDLNGSLLWVGGETYPTDLVDDRAEIDPALWWDALVQVVGSAPRDHLGNVRAIGFSGQMHGTVVLDEAGDLLRPAILWPDRRADIGVFESIDRDHPGVLGNPVVPGMPGPVLGRLRHNEPDVWRRLASISTPKDWLRGELADATSTSTDHSDASASLLYDVGTQDWSSHVVDAIGLPTGALPDLRPSTAPAGVTGQRAEQLGIPAATPMAIGAGDAAAALIGLGIERPGTVLLNVGTGAQALTIIEGPNASCAASAFHQYRTAGAAADWYAMAAVVNAGLVLDWVRSVLGLDWGPLYELTTDALTTVDDPVFTPFLLGERDPRVGLDARAGWSNLSAHHDAAALGRSALLGVASYIAERTRTLQAVTGADRVVLSGGSAANHGWVQLLTDLLGVDVDVVTDPDVSARGAAILGARSIGNDLPPAEVVRTVSPDASRSSRASDVLEAFSARLSSQTSQR